MVNLIFLFTALNNPASLSQQLTTQGGKPSSSPMQPAFNEAFRVYSGWAEGRVDSSEAIGTLRRLADQNLTDSGSFRFQLAQVLQAEGRTQEAATSYWAACHVPLKIGPKSRVIDGVNQATQNPYSRNRAMLSRIVDCLEDAGRNRDVAWILKSEHLDSRYELYWPTIEAGNLHEVWLYKLALKLKQDRPQDSMLLSEVTRFARSVDCYEADRSIFKSRDVPFKAPR